MPLLFVQRHISSEIMSTHWVALPVEEYGNYEVSRFGSIRNRETGYILKPFMHGKGYLQVALKGQKQYLVHRLVALTHVPLVKGAKHVNHKDGDKRHNMASNLEWCTPSQNNYHYHRNNPPMTTPQPSVEKMGIDPSHDPSPDLLKIQLLLSKVQDELLLVKGHVELLGDKIRDITELL
jgi:hypothetical protein